MKIGTKSVLFGAHCFFLHPIFLFIAWWKLYGFPWDPRLWLAFIVHDLGYIGKPNMDGNEGEEHPYWGAFVMGALFGKKWFEFTLYHSRFLAGKNNAQYSKLCVADKLAIILEPRWLYLFKIRLTGEDKEYMNLSKEGGKYHSEIGEIPLIDKYDWYAKMKNYILLWVEEHKDLKEDLWTKKT